MTVRTGIGYDAHRLESGLALWLGGIQIDFEKGLAGHSDGDVILHAIVDAALGAAGLGDIGTHFPSSDPQYRGISSLYFLRHVSDALDQHGWRLINLDATIVAEQPRLATFIQSMRDLIANTLGLDSTQVNVKATTTDGMGFPGRGEGIAAYAVVTIEEK